MALYAQHRAVTNHTLQRAYQAPHAHHELTRSRAFRVAKPDESFTPEFDSLVEKPKSLEYLANPVYGLLFLGTLAASAIIVVMVAIGWLAYSSIDLGLVGLISGFYKKWKEK